MFASYYTPSVYTRPLSTRALCLHTRRPTKFLVPFPPPRGQFNALTFFLRPPSIDHYLFFPSVRIYTCYRLHYCTSWPSPDGRSFIEVAEAQPRRPPPLKGEIDTMNSIWEEEKPENLKNRDWIPWSSFNFIDYGFFKHNHKLLIHV